MNPENPAARADGSLASGFLGPGDVGAPSRVEAVLGPGACRRVLAARELALNPRPLTDMEAAVLRDAAAPLLADLAATGMPAPDIRYEAREDRDGEAVCGFIQGPGITGEGIWVYLDRSPAEQVAELAEQVQNWAADRLHDAGQRPG